MVTAALLLSDPQRATDLVLRSSRAIAHVATHRSGYLVVLAPDADASDTDRLERSLAVLQGRGRLAPHVRIVALHELAVTPTQRPVRTRGPSRSDH
jgi:hypothetical protein